MGSRGKGPMLKEGFLNKMKKCKSPIIQKDLATDRVVSKGKSSRISNRHGRELFIGNEFIFNVVQQGLQELFKDEFENFMGMIPSNGQEKTKIMKKGKAVREILSGVVLCFRLGAFLRVRGDVASVMEEFRLVPLIIAPGGFEERGEMRRE